MIWLGGTKSSVNRKQTCEMTSVEKVFTDKGEIKNPSHNESCPVSLLLKRILIVSII